MSLEQCSPQSVRILRHQAIMHVISSLINPAPLQLQPNETSSNSPLSRAQLAANLSATQRRCQIAPQAQAFPLAAVPLAPGAWLRGTKKNITREGEGGSFGKEKEGRAGQGEGSSDVMNSLALRAFTFARL